MLSRLNQKGTVSIDFGEGLIENPTSGSIKTRVG